MPPRSASRHFKDAIYGQFARVAKALGSPHRMELVDLLAQGPRTVEALAQLSALSLANASQHLQVLRAAGLVEATKHGLFVTYRIADRTVADLFLGLRKVAETRLPDVDRIRREFLARRGQLEAIDEEALRRRVLAGNVTLIDVRPRVEYEAGHIPGALSIPFPELRRELKKLPRTKQIVAYCRGPYCVFASDAVGLLRKKGFRAVRLEEGVLDWAARGLRVAGSNST